MEGNLKHTTIWGNQSKHLLWLSKQNQKMPRSKQKMYFVGHWEGPYSFPLLILKKFFEFFPKKVVRSKNDFFFFFLRLKIWMFGEKPSPHDLFDLKNFNQLYLWNWKPGKNCPDLGFFLKLKSQPRFIRMVFEFPTNCPRLAEDWTWITKS